MRHKNTICTLHIILIFPLNVNTILQTQKYYWVFQKNIYNQFFLLYNILSNFVKGYY